MDRVFLDANVLFSAAYHRDSGLRQLWLMPDIELLTSSYARDEARRNLKERGQRARLTRLMRSVTVVPDALEGPLPRGIELPDKDKPILLAAIQAKATHLLTGDVRHFGPYFGRKIAGVLLLRPAQYLTEEEE